MSRAYRAVLVHFAILSASLMIVPLPVLAGPSQQVPVGIRAIAMGGAYSSLADDASALFWNPAGLTWIGHQEISATHADLFGTDIKDNLASFALPLSPHSAVAVDWYHSGFDDMELGFSESRLSLGYGRQLASFLTVGGTVKYLNRSTDLDGSSVRNGQGFGFDLGVIARPLNRVRIGVVGQDLFDTSISYSDGLGTTTAVPMNVRAGASFSPLRGALIAFDADDRWHLGIEGKPLEMIALRAGLQDDWDSPDAMTWSAGAGVKVGVFRFDYALEEHPVLGSTSHFGLAMEFNFNPAQIRIEKVEPRDLFASLHKTYAREPVAMVRLRNLDDRPLEAKVRILIPDIMDRPTERTVLLRPNANEEVPLTAVFPEQITGLVESRSVQMQVTATYQSARLPRTEKASARGVIYAPGAIDWSQGVEQAAAYVTLSDHVVDAFAREATRIAALSHTGSVQRNIVFGAALVDALASIGFAYVPDPNNPYSAISETPRAVDTIAYPRETLRRRTGDCDDSSVLLAALLENVGIATRFVDVPGHIFLMMDSGVHERNRVALGVEESRTVVAGERVWIPLETTSIRKGFAQTWEDGAESYASWASRGRVEVVDLEDAFKRYEPSVPGGDAPGVPAFDSTAFQARLTADLETVGEWREAHLRTLFEPGSAAGSDRSAANLELARVYHTAGKWRDAEAILERALTASPADVALLNNLGAVLAARGDLQAAETRFEEALEARDTDPGIWLNLGLVRYAMGDTTGAERPIAEGISRSGSYEKACALLALSPEAGNHKEGATEMSDAEARTLLKSSLQEVPWANRAPGDAAGRMLLQGHLYWKER
jgi:tetratricopeptide (TPR) repeat protein